MTEEVECRRSYRLKNKPAREYAFRNYLKKDWLPPAIIKINKKYDDIFSSVVTNAFLMDVQMTPDEYFAEKRAMAPEIAQKKARGPRGPYKKRPKPPADDDIVILGTRLIEIKKRIEKVKKSTEKRRKTMENTKKTRKDSNSSSDIEILPVPIVIFGCSCGKEFEKHEECHRHLYEDHSDHEDLHCIHCGHGIDEIRTNHICHVCNKFAGNLEQHLIYHYRNCSARHAVMECRFCTKQFKTVKEVMTHEQDKHLHKQVRRIVNIYKCNECSAPFVNAEFLTCHYSSHLDINSLWDKVDELQGKIDAQKEECPFCRINMSSRKSFRAHLLKSHWIACKSLSRWKNTVEIGKTDQEIKKEIDELTRDADMQELLMKDIKMEVKEEINDEEYPN